MIRDGLWSFDRYLILVKDFVGDQPFKIIQMKDATFWVCIHDLPLMARNEYIGNLIGASLGKVEETNLLHGDVECSEFMRIQISIDITRPLLRQNKLNIGLQDLVWVTFSYEQLFNFCYGIRGYSHKDCSQWPSEKEKCEWEGFLYGYKS